MSERFIGLKEIEAWPSVDAAGNPGYGVRYEDGYESWSPEDTFENAYRPIASGMTFSVALELVKRGRRVARAGWNGEGMFIFLVPGSIFMVNRPPLLGIYPEGTQISYRPHIDMRTADGSICVWTASQTDLIAEDWYTVDENGDALQAGS